MVTSATVSGFRSAVLVALLVLVGLHTYPHVRGHIDLLADSSSHDTHVRGPESGLVPDEAFSTQQLAFGADLISALVSARPSCHPISSSRDDGQEDATEPLTDDEVQKLAQSHSAMKRLVPQLASLLPFEENTTGIVMAASRYSLPSLLVSLRLLRRTGSRLPVEVFLPSRADYDVTVCREVLPKLHARCLVLSDAQRPSRFSVKNSKDLPLQTFSILFSTFQRVLFLNAHSFPAHDPEPLFDSPPFNTHGLVTWPAAWPYSASARFYNDLAGVSFTPSSAIQYATQDGMVMLDKALHRETLMMMAYYNYFGPEYYYHLLKQGSQDVVTGEKDTILPAAVALRAPFYQVKSGLRLLGRLGAGHGETDEKESIMAIVQADPSADFDTKAPHVAQDLGVGGHDNAGARKQQNVLASSTTRLGMTTSLRPFFVNTAMAPLDPAKLLEAGGPAMTSEGKFVRMYAVEKDDEDRLIEDFGFDLEQRIWESMAEEACRTDEELCTRIGRYFETVFDGFGVR